MTPAIDLLKQLNISFETHKYQVKDSGEGYGIAAAKALGVPESQLFKTLMIASDESSKQLAMAMIPVSHQLHLKLAASALGWKKAMMADQNKAQRATGYILGGISPLGQKTKLPALINETALETETIYVSAGRRGMQLSLFSSDLIQILNAKTTKLID